MSSLSYMVFSLNFEKLPCFSKIFLDFLYSENNLFRERFPANDPKNFVGDYLLQRAKTFVGRNELSELIKRSCSSFNLSSKQIFYLLRISLQNSVIVYTSCFPGFLAGPMVNFLKAYSVITLVKQLSQKFPEMFFIPLLWVDDDCIGSSDSKCIYSYDTFYNLLHFKGLSIKKHNKRISISNVFFDKTINEVISFFLKVNQIDRIEPGLSSFLKDTYYAGNSWCNAFIESVNYFFGEMGLLFIKGSFAREISIFSELVRKEISLLGFTYKLVERNLETLKKFDYSFKTKAKIPNLQFHRGNEIAQIKYLLDSKEFIVSGQILSTIDFMKLAVSFSDLFSPNSILKPVFQNFVMPSVAYVASPSEIGYYLLLREVFENFNVFFPLIVPRYSSTIICQRDLDKLKINFQSFIKKLKDTYIRTNAINDSIANLLFPKKNLQERLITPFYFLTVLGKDNLKIFFEKLASCPKDQHQIIFI